jgi:HK97 gp10 family phage protein
LANTSTTKLVGFEGLRKILRALPDEVNMRANKLGAVAMAQFVREKAKSNAPKGETGNLSRAIIVRKEKDGGAKWIQFYDVAVRTRGGRKSKKTGVVPDSAYYWHFVEFGTSRMAAQPFLRPAIEDNRDAVVGSYRDRASRIVDAIAAKLRRQYGEAKA